MNRHLMTIFFVMLPLLGVAEDSIGNGDVVFPCERITIDSTLKVLNESELIEMALQYSRKMQNLNTNIEIAGYRLKSSGKWDNPEIRIRGFSTDYFSKSDDLLAENFPKNIDELSIGVRFRFPDLGELGEKKQEATVRLWDRKVEEIRYRQALIARVRRDCADVIKRDQMMELAARREELENKRIGIIEQMVQIGRRSVVYFTKAKMWHAESKNDYARAIQNQVQARRELAKRTGMDINTPLISFLLPEVTLELDALIDTAYQNRPEISLEEQTVELAVKQNRYERLQVLPKISFIEYNYHLDDRINHTDWRELRMGIDIPLFDWNIGNIKATNLAVKKKEDAYEAIRETIETEVRTAHIVYQDLLLDWKNFNRDANNLISEAEKVVQNAHQHQTLLPDEVLEMELTIVDTQRLLAQKRQDLAYALIDLCYTLGLEDYGTLTE
ncbi:TolC family protein [bacterium]|nr:TolC family protein [bacterium]MBU1635412.1 TolC family protein [bacterium]MBU1872313.1 TolC family protein [bacterium]